MDFVGRAELWDLRYWREPVHSVEQHRKAPLLVYLMGSKNVRSGNYQKGRVSSSNSGNKALHDVVRRNVIAGPEALLGLLAQSHTSTFNHQHLLL
jgi:hypothetical protein